MSESQGWVKLHRELLDKPIWLLSTPEQKAILITLLLMANHKDNKWEWNGQQFVCAPGQFITSLEKIAERAGQGVSIQNVRTAIKRFENLEFLTNESTKTGRLITIANWGTYQEYDEPSNKASNKDLTKTSQRANKDLTTNKNDKNDKNDKKRNIYPPEFDAFWAAYPRNKEKARAFKCYSARLKEGYTAEFLLQAAQAYAEDCIQQGREERFIKHPATFLNADHSFEDYLIKNDEPAGPVIRGNKVME